MNARDGRSNKNAKVPWNGSDCAMGGKKGVVPGVETTKSAWRGVMPCGENGWTVDGWKMKNLV